MIRYAELHASSAFSFLESASLPEELAERAAALQLPALALVDANGLYGAPRFYKAAKAVGLRPLVGAELSCADPDARRRPFRLTVLVATQRGYKDLCRLISRCARDHPKGQMRVDWAALEEHARELHCLTGGAEGFFDGLYAGDAAGMDRARRMLERLNGIFPGRLHVELQRHHQRAEERRNQALIHLAREKNLPLVATNGVRYAHRDDKDAADVLACIGEHTTLEAAGTLLAPHREACLKSPAEMAALFHDQPRAVEAAAELAGQLSFTLDDLGYKFPDYPLPPNETPISFLRRKTWAAAPHRFPEVDAAVRAQLEKELALIDKLGLAGYFLIVWDIIQFCKENHILVQGRGSAANSAVCFALSITAVNPIKMELLFERFLSDERGEWPDIDLDLPSGEQRERVIQHLYKKYGAPSAAMTANVITYQPRSAMREAAKVFGYDKSAVDRLSRHVGRLSLERARPDQALLAASAADAGFLKEDRRLRQTLKVATRLLGLPRHLGQHSGGMVLAAGRLDEIVPIEPASMPGRWVIQWDKEDCADLKIIKVDILGLGMLQVVEETTALVGKHEQVRFDMAHVPPDDPAVYEMLRRGDTLGLFQIESRAQIASLPHHQPREFYDIVTQIALVRPGPILGGMMRPFFDRFNGKEKVTYPHPSLEPVLKRTFGIPIFQEQILRIAIVAAGFTGGQAEELRRAMGSKRSAAKMQALEKRLRDGMAKKGIGPAFCEQVLKTIYGFASYGFPESHSASFALIAYASGYLKAHHPAAFYTALLNAWPMGFYHPASLVQDAERHGITVHPIDVQHSGWSCRWEASDAFRIGLKYIQGLSKAHGQAIEDGQAIGLYRDLNDLARRCSLQRDELETLAHAGALQTLGMTRRAALWQAAQVARPQGPLFQDATLDGDSPLPEMDAKEETIADLRSTRLTVGPHLLHYSRAALRAQGIHSSKELLGDPNHSRVQTAGFVVVRQHPPTAKGFVFLTLEDEFGMTQGILNPSVYERDHAVVLDNGALILEGVLQKDGAHLSLTVERARPLSVHASTPSHDFH